LKLPPSLVPAADIVPALPAPVPPPPAPVVAPPIGLAVEVTRVVPTSGNMTISGHQFWLGTGLAGQEITIWADTTVVHLLRDGVRLRSVPSRFTLPQLQHLLVGGGRKAGPPPIAAAPARRSSAVEVDRTISACGLLRLAGRQHPVGYHLAGRRVTARLDHGVLHLLDHDRTVLRSLPNPLTPADLARLCVMPARPAPPRHPPPACCGLTGGSAAAAPYPLPDSASRSGSGTPATRSRSSWPTPPSGSTTPASY